MHENWWQRGLMAASKFPGGRSLVAKKFGGGNFRAAA